MRPAALILFLSMCYGLASAQGIAPVSLLQKYQRPAPVFGNLVIVPPAVVLPNTLSALFAGRSFVFQQGKLPLFCAMEDKLWRRTGLGIRFRITDAPLGF